MTTQTIQIKRSSNNNSPSSLAHGELAYSYTGATDGDPAGNGGILYIGRPGTDAGSEQNDIIGGKVYIDKLNGIAAGANNYSLPNNNVTNATVNGNTLTLTREGDGVASTTFTANNYSLPTAASDTLGGIELFSDTVQSTAANTVSTTANRTYGIQLNSDGQAVVNVPWDDTVNTYTGSTGVTVDAGAKTIAIGQSVGTTDDVTFDDLTLTGSAYLDNDEGVRFSQGIGLGLSVGNEAIIPTRVTIDELPIATMTTNERADVYRYIERVADGTESAPAAKYLHLFDINNSGSITSDDESAWSSAVGTVLGATQAYQDYLNAKNNATDYYTDFVQDIIDGTDDSWTTSTSGISLGTSTNAFNEIHAKGSATIGNRLTLEKTSGDGGSGKFVFKNTVAGENDIALTLNEEGSFTVVKHDDDYDDGSSGGGTTETLLQVSAAGALSGVKTATLSGTSTTVTFNNTATHDVDGTAVDRYDYRLRNSTDKLRLEYSQTQFANADSTTLATFENDKVDINADFDADGTVYLGKAAVIGEGDANNPDEPAKHTTVRANLTVDGDLTVSGSTTTVNTTTINLGDNIIELNSDIGSNNATENAGLEVNRGNYTNVRLFWDETNHDWRVDAVGDVSTAATTSALLTADNFTTKVATIDGGSFDT